MATNQNYIDPKSGFCKETKTYHPLRPPATLPNPSLPLDITTFVFSLNSNTSLPSSALIDATTGRHHSYTELRSRVETLAAALQSTLNLTKGQTALILSPNSIDVPLLYLSLFSIGVIISPSNPFSTPSEILRQTLISKPQIAFSDSSNAHKIPNLPLPTVIIDSPSFAALFSRQLPRRKTAINQQDTAAILFSSGTTGSVKGVELTHRNFIAAVAGIRSAAAGRESPEVLLLTSPLFHAFGMFFSVKAVAMGETVVLMKRFEVSAMLRAVEEFRVTTVSLAPPIVVALVKLPEVNKYDLGSLTEVKCGGAPLRKDIIEAFAAKFPKISVAQGYGLTESTAGIVRSHGPEECRYFGSTGRLTANFEAKIVDPETGSHLPPCKQGEIWIRGPAIMKGYVADEEATASTLNAEGWLKTGDLGYFNDEGFLFVVGRLKELIKYKAYQVAPAELEQLLQSHPDIVEAAVIPYPHEEAGQIPMAFVVREFGSTLNEAQIMDFIAKQVDYVCRSFYHGRTLEDWGVLSDAQLDLVIRAGFGHFRRIAWLSTDTSLCYALAEHYWPSTSTFHFSFGEMSITLQDVTFITGLRISGHAVTGEHHRDYRDIYQRLLGCIPPDPACTSGRLSLSWLRSTFGAARLPDAPTPLQLQYHTRAYLVTLLGCTIFADTSGSHVPSMYLTLFEDFDRAGEYAWGAATLAYLYRQLRLFTFSKKTAISGCIMLLQVWAHEHLPVGRPVRAPAAPMFPCALRWQSGQRAYVDPHHDLSIYRQELDLLLAYQIVWQPYADMDLAAIGVPMLETAHFDSLVRCCIICYNILEFHPAERCLRQFGMHQIIPPVPLTWPIVDRQGVGPRDWAVFHSISIRDWDERVERFSVHGDIAIDISASWPSDEFRAWYGQPRVHNPYMTFSEPRYAPRGYREEILDIVTLQRDELQRRAYLSAETVHRVIEYIQPDMDPAYCTFVIEELRAMAASLQADIPLPRPFPILAEPPPHPIEAQQRSVPRIRARRRAPRQPQAQPHVQPLHDDHMDVDELIIAEPEPQQPDLQPGQPHLDPQPEHPQPQPDQPHPHPDQPHRDPQAEQPDPQPEHPQPQPDQPHPHPDQPHRDPQAEQPDPQLEQPHLQPDLPHPGPHPQLHHPRPHPPQPHDGSVIPIQIPRRPRVLGRRRPRVELQPQPQPPQPQPPQPQPQQPQHEHLQPQHPQPELPHLEQPQPDQPQPLLGRTRSTSRKSTRGLHPSWIFAQPDRRMRR